MAVLPVDINPCMTAIPERLKKSNLHNSTHKSVISAARKQEVR